MRSLAKLIHLYFASRVILCDCDCDCDCVQAASDDQFKKLKQRRDARIALREEERNAKLEEHQRREREKLAPLQELMQHMKAQGAGLFAPQ
jgi:hypothetical protein